MLYQLMIFLLHLTISIGNPPADWDIRAKLPPLQFKALKGGKSGTKGNGIDQNEFELNEIVTNDCLLKLLKCEADNGICKVDLEIFKQFCGDWTDERSLLVCNDVYIKECISALRTLQIGRLNMSHCTCDGQTSRSIEDLAKCNLLRRNLNSHPCQKMSDTDRVSRPGTHVPHSIYVFPSESETSNHQSINIVSTPVAVEEGIDNKQNKTDRLPSFISPLTTPAYQDFLSVPDRRERITTPTSPLGILTTENADDSQRILTEQNNSSRMPSCLKLLDACVRSHSCAKALNQVRALCTTRSCKKLRKQCLWAYQEFQTHGTFHNCTCLDEADRTLQQRCLDYKLSVHSNPCIESFRGSLEVKNKYFPIGYHSNYTESLLRFNDMNDSKTAGPKTLVSGAPSETIETMNCFDVYTQCMRDDQCLSHYLRLFEFCKQLNNSGGECSGRNSLCANELTIFYSRLPWMEQSIRSCSCPKNDHWCIVHRGLFRRRCFDEYESFNEKCSDLWSKCASSKSCVEKLKQFLDTCHQTGVQCGKPQGNCSLLLNELRNVFQSWRCNCMVDEVFSNVAMEFRVSCQTFRMILEQRACDDEEHILPKIPTTGRQAACFVSERIRLPLSANIRLYGDWSLGRTTEDEASCSQLCSCTTGCLHQFCPMPHGDSFFNMNGDIGVNDSQKLRQDSPINHSSCLYIPMIDSTCGCTPEGNVLCNQSSIHERWTFTDYQLRIHFEPEELSTILKLTHENILDPDRLLYSELLEISNLLMLLFASTPFSSNCDLRLHRIIFRDQKYPQATPVRPKPRIRIPRDYGEREPELRYILMKHKSQKNASNQDDEHFLDCQLYLRLLTLMVNNRFPHIHNHPLLSVLRKAEMIAHPSRSAIAATASHEPDKQTMKNMKSVNAMVSWRQPKRSIDRKTVYSDRGKNKAVAISTGVKLTLVTYFYLYKFFCVVGPGE